MRAAVSQVSVGTDRQTTKNSHRTHALLTQLRPNLDKGPPGDRGVLARGSGDTEVAAGKRVFRGQEGSVTEVSSQALRRHVLGPGAQPRAKPSSALVPAPDAHLDTRGRALWADPVLCEGWDNVGY